MSAPQMDPGEDLLAGFFDRTPEVRAVVFEWLDAIVAAATKKDAMNGAALGVLASVMAQACERIATLEAERTPPCPDCNDVGEVLVAGEWATCPNPSCTGRLFAAPLRPALVHDWQGC